MISEKAKKNADACRFCWMCRYVCPIGQVTGKETHNPRPKGLMLSLVERGEKYSSEMAADMYECCLCEACSNDCETGFEPPVFMREARTHAMVNGLVPDNVNAVINKYFESGNIYGLDEKDVSKDLKKLIDALPDTAEYLLYIGDTAMFKSPETALAFINILKKAKINFTVLKNGKPSGVKLGDLIGFVDEVNHAAKQTTEEIKNSKAKTMIVLNPSDARMFRQQYAEWGYSPAEKVVTATSFAAELISSNKLAPKKLSIKKATFHDPCRLARDLDETQSARDIINAMGIEISEMFNSKDRTKCCGGEVVNEHSPHISSLTSAGRWEDVKNAGAELLITACPGCMSIMSKKVPDNCSVEDIFMLLDRAYE